MTSIRQHWRRRQQRLMAALPCAWVDKTPRHRSESDTVLHRRRRLVAGVSLAGAGLLGMSLSTKPGSPQFYGLTLGVAATWIVGGLASGPLPLGQTPHRDHTPRRPVITPVLTGVGAFAVFYACALAARHIPMLNNALAGVLQYAHQGSSPLVLLTTLANGAGEEVFFRGALYAAAGKYPLTLTTTVYSLTTTATRNPALILASAVMGTLLALQRRATGGIQAPILTHLTWSTLMLHFMPPCSAATQRPSPRAPRTNQDPERTPGRRRCCTLRLCRGCLSDSSWPPNSVTRFRLRPTCSA